MIEYNLVFYDYLHSCIRLQNAAAAATEKTSSLEFWIDQTALSLGSSAKGRRKSVRHLLGRQAFSPVVLSVVPPCALIPAQICDYSSAVYVRYDRICAIRKNGKSHCTICFCDGQKLEAQNGRRMQRLYLRTDYVLKTLQLSQSSQ